MEGILYERRNTDDIFNRSVIGGLIGLMNNAVSYEQIWDDNVVETVKVPCAFDLVNSDNERFLQDNYTFFGRACFGEKKIDGKFDMLPRILLRYTGSNIEASNITNRFVKGRFLRNENGKLTSYIAFMYCIPINMSFECTVFFDSLDTGFKIEQAIRETFYKNRTYNVLYRGMKVGCRVGFPEQTPIEKSVSYSFDSERRHKMTFSLGVECYQPCFDNATAIESGKRIEYIGVDYSYYNNATGPADKLVNIKFKPDSVYPGLRIPTGTNYEVRWDSSCNVSDVCTVSLSYIKDGVERQIATPLYNQRFYVWYVPDSLTNYTQPEIIYLGIDNSNIINRPSVKIIPNDKGEFDADSFIIVDPGLFAGAGDKVDFLMEYVDDDGNPVTSDYEHPYSFVLRNRKIHSVVVPEVPFKYGKKLEKGKISLKLSYSINKEIYDQVDNVLII